jgi:hypothetical protein
LLIDSDAFILLGGSGLIQEAAEEVFGLKLSRLRRLFPLPLMLERGRLAKKYPPAIREKVRSWCSVIEPIREAPSTSTRQRLLGIRGIDDGEELLFGLAFEKSDHLLLTNDKTALRALCTEPSLSDFAQQLCGRVVCLESVLRALLERQGIRPLAEAVSPMRHHNGMLNAIFSMGTETDSKSCLTGLSSYITHLQSELLQGFLLNL